MKCSWNSHFQSPEFIPFISLSSQICSWPMTMTMTPPRGAPPFVPCWSSDPTLGERGIWFRRFLTFFDHQNIWKVQLCLTIKTWKIQVDGRDKWWLFGFERWIYSSQRQMVTRKCTPRKTRTVLEACWNLSLLGCKAGLIFLFSFFATIVCNFLHV